MLSATSRRALLGGIATGLTSATAGCLGDDPPVAHCSGFGEDTATGPLRKVGTLDGREQVSLGILVSEDAPTTDEMTAIVVRNRDGDLVADVPLRENRDMSDLEPDIDPTFGDTGGELYAVQLGQPPQHAALDVQIVDSNGTAVDSASYRFNCYRPDGELP